MLKQKPFIKNAVSIETAFMNLISLPEGERIKNSDRNSINSD